MGMTGNISTVVHRRVTKMIEQCNYLNLKYKKKYPDVDDKSTICCGRFNASAVVGAVEILTRKLQFYVYSLVFEIEYGNRVAK
ncbi:hypothetical protein T4D_5304 [Trichinella pseudospiralis]|uniref:Uncharacterized protein n=1 Tax=Trichinella pseudospiralis TaxID=6337 RepID=A0A0V1FQ95_TRIPS|nr:hypothetical protein T4D_5304 [Trichinella pseudospiralis]